jgi:hypothetical protein
MFYLQHSNDERIQYITDQTNVIRITVEKDYTSIGQLTSPDQRMHVLKI